MVWKILVSLLNFIEITLLESRRIYRRIRSWWKSFIYIVKIIWTCTYILGIVVFFFESILIGYFVLFSWGNVFFCCMVIFQTCINAINFNICSISFPINIFYCFKNFFPKITFITIIVLIFNMNNKFFVILLCTFSNCFATLNSDFSLDSFSFNIVKILIC